MYKSRHTHSANECEKPVLACLSIVCEDVFIAMVAIYPRSELQNL